MSKNVKTIVLRTAGTNCDQEVANAFKACQSKVDLVHINHLISGKIKLKDYHILVFPGGFTYGDDIESGKILSNELKSFLKSDLEKFIKAGKLIIGICNGFQVLVKTGILPGPFTGKQSATLTFNDCGEFQDRWVYLEVDGKSVWTEGLKGLVYYPVAHAEGKFVTSSTKVLDQLKENGQVAFRYRTENGDVAEYPDNPNGSLDSIAGITDKTGRVLGLMPHPERHFLFHHHPRWTRLIQDSKYGDGYQLFKNGVKYIKKKFIK